MARGRVCTGQYANVYRGSSVLLIHRDRLQIIIARLIAITHFEANLSFFFSHATTEDVEVLIKNQRNSPPPPPVSRTQRSCSERKRVFQNKRLRRFTEPQGNARFIMTRPFLLVFAVYHLRVDGTFTLYDRCRPHTMYECIFATDVEHRASVTRDPKKRYTNSFLRARNACVERTVF